MAFIAKADLQKLIKADMLTALLDGDDTVVATAADEAIAKAKEMLSGVYDMDTELAKTGSNRHDLLLTYCIDIAIYNVWRYVDPMAIPKYRVDHYKEAIDWLKGVMKGDYATSLATSTESDESGGPVIFGSNTARDNQY